MRSDELPLEGYDIQKPYMKVFKLDIRIHNVLALASIQSDKKFLLSEAIEHFMNASYTHEGFPTIRVEVKGDITGATYTISLFEGGRIQSAGGCMPREAGLAMKKVIKRLAKGLGLKVKMYDFLVHNLLGVLDTSKNINLHKLYEIAPGAKDFEPAKFPALRVSIPIPLSISQTDKVCDDNIQIVSGNKRKPTKSTNSKNKVKVETITVSIFANGKMNFVGGKSIKSILYVVEELKPYIDACN